MVPFVVKQEIYGPIMTLATLSRLTSNGCPWMILDLLGHIAGKSELIIELGPYSNLIHHNFEWMFCKCKTQIKHFIYEDSSIGLIFGLFSWGHQFCPQLHPYVSSVIFKLFLRLNNLMCLWEETKQLYVFMCLWEENWSRCLHDETNWIY